MAGIELLSDKVIQAALKAARSTGQGATISDGGGFVAHRANQWCRLVAFLALGEMASTARPRACRILVSDVWLRATELPCSDRFLGSQSDVAEHVRVQFEASAWPADERGRLRWLEAAALRPRVAVMYPGTLLQAIDAAIEPCGLALESMQPASVLACELVKARRPASVAVIEGARRLLFPSPGASPVSLPLN